MDEYQLNVTLQLKALIIILKKRVLGKTKSHH